MKYVYLLPHPDKPNWFKCGETSQPSKRIEQLGNAHASELKYHSLYEARAANGDRECHKALSHLNRHREWFEGDIDEAADIVQSVTWSAPTNLDSIEESATDMTPVRRTPLTDNSSRSHYRDVSFLDVVCPI